MKRIHKITHLTSRKVLLIAFHLVLLVNAKYKERALTDAEKKEADTKYKADIEKWEQEQIAQAKGVTNPYKTPSKVTKEPLRAYKWIMEYDAPFETGEIFFIVLTPMVIGRFIHYLMRSYRPKIKHKVEEVSEFPMVPLVFLQATAGERQMKNEKRNGLHWLAEKYIVIASDEYVNMNIGGKNYQQFMKVKKRPWRMVKSLVSVHGWWRRAQKRMEFIEAGQPVPEYLKPLRLQRRPTIFELLKRHEIERRANAKSGKENVSQALGVSRGNPRSNYGLAGKKHKRKVEDAKTKKEN